MKWKKRFELWITSNLRQILHPLIWSVLHLIYFLPSRIVGESFYINKIRKRSKVDRSFTSRLLEQSLVKDPLFTKLSDKCEVRNIVSEIAGSQYLPKIFQICSKADEIDFALLPEEFVIKTNHGSGGNIIVTRSASSLEFLPNHVFGLPFKTLRIRPENFSQSSAAKILNHWLSKDFSWFPGKPMPEWGYKHIQRKILVEEFLPGTEGFGPIEYRCWCLKGEIRFIRAVQRTSLNNLENANSGLLTVFSRSWEQMDTTEGAQIGTYKDAVPPLSIPPNADEFILAVESLASLVTCVRVDMNVDREKVLFSEMTLYPNSGMTVLAPQSLNQALGDIWGD